MNSRPLIAALLAVAGAFAWADGVVTEALACRLVDVDPHLGHFSVGPWTIDLGEADDKAHPRAWQGPITIAAGDKAACTIDAEVSIVERPLYIGGHRLLATTYSGSNRTVFGIDMRTCKVVWRSAPFAGTVGLKAGVLQMGKGSRRLGPDCAIE
jgi:hypothetical protein